MQVIVTVQAKLAMRESGQVLFERPSMEARERYEISIDQAAYFDESNAALDRVSEPTLNFPANFLKNMATSLMHAGTTINGTPSTRMTRSWQMMPPTVVCFHAQNPM